MSSLATGTPRLEEANTDNSRCSHAAQRVFAPNAIRGPSHIPAESAGRERSGARAAAKQARSYFGLDPDASVEEIRAVADYYPVFRVLSAG
jgi:hypothetical protein